ncbi:MAG: Asp23/Gls24 family envelope stress response protein [Oscillospiraceae bacterium]|nr:Asp23/Gls24 family envelope stress response protein [Oscillospiraceae bacterium]
MGETKGKAKAKTETKKEELLPVVEVLDEGEGADNDGVRISNEVVSVIAGVAVAEVAGVYGMAGGIAGGLSEVLSGKKNLSKGIKTEVGEKEVRIDVSIVIEYGVRIPDVAFEIQNRVKKAVESMTGLNVVGVNIHVQGVNTEEGKSLEVIEEHEEEK